MKKVVTVLAVLALMVGTAQAAEITWGDVFDIASVDDLAGGGPILYALNMGEDPAGGFPMIDVINSRETISFEAWWVDGIGNASGGYFTGDGGTAGDDNLNKVLNSHTYLAAAPGFIPSTLIDLTVGQEYQFQFIAAADTRSCCADRTQALDDGMGNATGNMLRSGPGSVLGTFVADADTQAINVSGPTDPGMSAIIVREIPEPSTIAMLASALVGLFLVWRRR